MPTIRARPAASPVAATHGVGLGTIVIFLIVATTLALWPVCTAEFTSRDDPVAIENNPTMLPPTWHSVAEWWTKPVADLWIPVTYTTWGLVALVAQVPGEAGPALDPYVFHTVNLLLLVLSALVVFRLLEMLVRHRWAAAAGAALFALHPVQVEPVAWAAGMKDVLCGLLSLLALWQYLVAFNMPAGDKRRGWIYLLATVAYALALLAKPTAIVVPLMAAVLQGSMVACSVSGRGAARLWWGLREWRLGIWIAIAIPVMFIAHRVQPVPRASEFVPLAWRPVVALDAIAFYVGKSLWPIRLCVDYGRTPWKIFADGQAYWTWIVPVAIAALLVFARRMPMVIAGAAVYVLGLLPVLGLVGFDYQGISTVADRYLYLSMFGAALVAATLLAQPAVSRHRAWAGAAMAAILGLLAFRTFTLTWTWHDDQALWSHTLAVNPLSIAANDTLSFDALHAGDYPRAKDYAEQSIRGNPRRPHGYVNLANVYAEMDQPKDAVAMMMQAYRLEPRDPQVLVDLGVQLVNNKQFAAAEQRFREALAIDPNNASAEVNLAITLNQLGRRAEGFAEIQRAAKSDPDSAQVELTLGDFYREMGKFTEAHAAYESALRAQPGYAPAITRLHDLGTAP